MMGSPASIVPIGSIADWLRLSTHDGAMRIHAQIAYRAALTAALPD